MRRIANFAQARLDATPMAGSLNPPTTGFNLNPLRVEDTPPPMAGPSARMVTTAPVNGSRKGGRGGWSLSSHGMIPAGLSPLTTTTTTTTKVPDSFFVPLGGPRGYPAFIVIHIVEDPIRISLDEVDWR